jgi:hypothetical protein
MNYLPFHGRDYLFHYTKASITNSRILDTMQLQLFPLEKVDDPRENKWIYFGYRYMPRFKDFKPPQSFGDPDLMGADYLFDTYFRRHSKICCFCQNDSRRKVPGYEKSRMWNQYAENYAGVCIVFSKSKLIKRAKMTFENCIYASVKYDLMKGRSAILPDYHMRKHKIKDTTVEWLLLKVYNNLYFEKHMDYRDENEFRIVTIDKENEEVYIDISDSIEGVVLGDAMETDTKWKIMEKCHNHEIPHYEQVVFNRQFVYID